MAVLSIWFALVLVLMDNISASPLMEGGLTARTLFQQNMKINTRSAFKRITMSHSIIYDNNAQNIHYIIRAYNTKVCQLRIDFTYLDLDQPDVTNARPYARCNRDRLVIDGMAFDLCGRLLAQHVYVPFDVKRLTDEIKMEFQVGSGSFAMWNMEVNQIECGHKAALVTFDERQAPDGCLQYFYQSSGRVDSFNQGNYYYGDTRYAICFNRNYNDFAALELSEISFEMDSIAAPGFDSDCLDGVLNNEKDYIAIPFAEVTGEADPHSLFCDTSLDEQELIFKGTGPIVIHVNTDRVTDIQADVEKGFSFRYKVSTYRP